jgi:hypothetical protein
MFRPTSDCRFVPRCDITGADLHQIHARANSLELFDRI